MNESRKPAARTGISLLVMALSLTLAAPVLAVPAATKDGVTTSKHKTVRAKRQQPQLAKKAPPAPAAVAGDIEAVKPAPTLAVSQPTLPTAAPTQVLPAATVVPAPASIAVAAVPAPASIAVAAVPAPAPIAVAAVPAVTVAAAPAPAAPSANAANPYLSGWYRPLPAAVLPAVAAGQIHYSARYVSDGVTAIPARLADALPSIKRVFPTGGRELWVANVKCPAEMITGQYFFPANAMREGVNGLFSRLNDTQALKFDIQLVCS